MYLETLRLHNFRCYEELQIRFHKQLTVLVGNNGAGKTTVLEGAAIAVSTLFTGFDNLSGRSIDKKNDALRIVYSLGDDDDVQPQYPVEIFANGELEGRSIKWKRSLNGDGGNTTVKDAKELTSISAEYQKRLRSGDSTLILPLIAYYGTGRLWDYHRQKKYDTFMTNTRTNGYIDAMDGTANLKLMLDWLRKTTIKQHQRQEENQGAVSVLAVVYQAMEQCFTWVSGYQNVKCRYNIDTNEVDVYYNDESGRRMCVTMNQLSDGYKGTISLIADIAYRMAILNPQLSDRVLTDTDGIILIDEVDLHLHPEWQQRILGDLVTIFPKVQFIVSTHAPAVINTVTRDQLCILDQLHVKEPAGEIYGKDANGILRSVMDTTERPKAVMELFARFYQALDDHAYEHANQILDRIEAQIGDHDPELASCRVQLDLELR